MAKVKFSALISEMRNKLNGSVFSRNRAGAYLRNKVTPLNPQSLAQTTKRNFFAAVSQAWKGLTQAQILAWNNAVSNFVGTDIFGDSLTPSGFNLHQRINQNITLIGGVVLTDPPVNGPVNSFATMSIAAANGAQTLAITYTPAIDAGDSVLVYATPAVSPGKSFVKSEYRLIDVMLAADVTPFSIETEYIAVHGAIGAEGQKIFLKVKVIETLTGLSGTILSASTLIAA